MKNETVKFMGVNIPKYKNCPTCGKKNGVEFLPGLYYGYAPRCNKCQEKKNKEDEKNAKPFKTPRYKGYIKDLVAFGHDTKTGRAIWLDSKGRRIDNTDSRVPYDMRNDPHGWKTLGKKVRNEDAKGNPYS